MTEYLKDLNGTKAAIRAGYSPRGASVHAARLLAHPSVSALIARTETRQLERAEVTADRIIEELRRVAFFDKRRLYDRQGNILPVDQWDEDIGSAVAASKTVKRNVSAADGITDTVWEVKLWDKLKALEILAKHHGILKEQSEVLHRFDFTGVTDAVLLQRMDGLRAMLAEAREPKRLTPGAAVLETVAVEREEGGS